MSMHFGIDYGSKMAGTTVICYNQNGKLHLLSSEKKKDSDQFINSKIQELNPVAIYIDAPLSLPAAYFGKGDNFHFRKCDIETSAMSPMFLGGLTARAMKLKNSNSGVPFYETYPSYFIKEVAQAKEVYKKKEKEVNKPLLKSLQTFSEFPLPKKVENYHQVDAIICWISGNRYVKGNHITFGEEEEGVIFV